MHTRGSSGSVLLLLLLCLASLMACVLAMVVLGGPGACYDRVYGNYVLRMANVRPVYGFCYV